MAGVPLPILFVARSASSAHYFVRHPLLRRTATFVARQVLLNLQTTNLASVTCHGCDLRLLFSSIPSQSRRSCVTWFDKTEKVVWTSLKKRGRTAQSGSATITEFRGAAQVRLATVRTQLNVMSATV